jgi:hypothetical protein
LEPSSERAEGGRPCRRGEAMPRRPSSRLLGEVGGRRARQSPSCVKLCLEGVLDGEGAADVAGLDVLAGPLIPAACEVC